MRGRVTFREAKARKATLCALAFLALGLGGCIADTPIVSSDGTIAGGDPKLRGLLIEMQAGRDVNGQRELGVVEAAYVASVQPTRLSASCSGTFPEIGGAVPTRYELIYSVATLKEARVAVVTEWLLIREGGTYRSESYSGLLGWDGVRWEELPMIRMGVIPVKPMPE